MQSPNYKSEDSSLPFRKIYLIMKTWKWGLRNLFTVKNSAVLNGLLNSFEDGRIQQPTFETPVHCISFFILSYSIIHYFSDFPKFNVNLNA